MVEISIILPTYNRESLIDNAIRSVLDQSTKDWELLIIDDGSTDNTEQAVNKYKQHPNIIYIKQNHQNQTVAMNKGIEKARGRYITFIGSDDTYTKDHLKQRIEIMKKKPELDIIEGGLKVIGDQYVPDANNSENEIHISKVICGGTLFGKRSAFKALNGFRNMEFAEEKDLWERAQQKFTVSKIILENPTYIYNRTSNSVTMKND